MSDRLQIDLLQGKIDALTRDITRLSDGISANERQHWYEGVDIRAERIYTSSAEASPIGAATADITDYIDLIVPVYHRAADVSNKTAAVAASTKYWIKIDEDYNSGVGQVTLETGAAAAAWGTPSASISIWRILETDANKVATFYRPCWSQAHGGGGFDLRAMDVVETTV